METTLHPLIKALRRFSQLAAGFLAFGAVITGCVTRNAALDASLEAARVKLLEAAITRDQAVISPILARDFSWREDAAPADEEPFDFWNQRKLWGELQMALQERPVLRGGLFISPKEAVRESYRGPKVAWRQVAGEWKLAYFYPGTSLAQ